MKFRKLFKDICLVFIICALNIQCQTALIKKYKKNGMAMEKISIDELDEYASTRKKARKDQTIKYLNIRKDDSLNNVSFNITEKIDGKINLLSVSKKDGKYVNIQKTIYLDDYQEINTFNEDGNLKSKVLVGKKKVIEDDKFGDIVLINTHLGTSIYFDDEKMKVKEYDYDKLYEFELKDVIVFLKENYSENGELAIDKLFLSEFTKMDVEMVLNEYRKNNIPLKKEYPYWFVQFTYNNSKGLVSKTVYIDGVTGDKIAEQVSGPIRSVD